MTTPIDSAVTSTKSSLWWEGLATLSESEAGTAADATALSLLGLLVFCAVCFIGGALVLRKREAHSDAGEIESTTPRTRLERPEISKKSDLQEDSPKKQPWERSADWWKDQEEE